MSLSYARPRLANRYRGLTRSLFEELGEKRLPDWTVGDYVAELIGILMTQVRPDTHLNIRQDFQNLTYQVILK